MTPFSCGGSGGPSDCPAPLFRPRAGHPAVRLKIGRVYHDRRRSGGLRGQPIQDRGAAPLDAPSLPAVLEGLWRALFLGGSTSPQTVAIEEYYVTQNPPIIDAKLAMALGNEDWSRDICASLGQKRLLKGESPCEG